MKSSRGNTLMGALKEAVSERHARMAALPFIVALTTGQLPLESYVGQLRALAVIHGTLEHEFMLIDSGAIRTLLQDRPSRLVHLRRDLSVFDPLLIPDIPAAVEQTRSIAAMIRRCRAERPRDLLGILYVLQGTTLGNHVHLPDVLKTFGSRTSGAAHYYAGYGHDTSRQWKAFSAAMNALPLEQEDRRRMIRAALDFFSALEALFSTLYPLEHADRVFTAGMLNPEAGDHPIPGDEREIRAALAAARRCREEFPYFDERYGDRGKGFAGSDSAWLATLAALPQEQLLSQVEWLRRVLGNRGMPSVTLERQLVLLHEELTAAVPEKRDRYQGLPEAAQRLKAERLQYIAEQVFNDISAEFHRATDDELGGRFVGTGELILSAVCDREAGVTGAVSSLIPWLTDVDRFPPQWIAAVIKAQEQAIHSLAKQVRYSSGKAEG